MYSRFLVAFGNFDKNPLFRGLLVVYHDGRCIRHIGRGSRQRYEVG